MPVTTPGWTAPLPGTYQWRFRDFEPAASTGKVWWQAQDGSDVFLGFTRPWRLSHAVTWTRLGRNGGSVKGGVYLEGPGSGWSAMWTGAGDRPWLQATFKRPVHLRELRLVGGDTSYIKAFPSTAGPGR